MSLLCKELLYALILLLGSLTFGFIIAYPSPAMPSMREKWPGQISDTEYQFFNSASSLFAIAGPFICNFILNYLGRKPTTCIIAIFASISWFLLLATSPKLIWFTIFVRALCGIAMGAFSSIIPMYIVELAPVAHAAFFGSLNQLGVATGIVICYLVGNWADWFQTAIVGGCIPALLIFLVWLIPESPALYESLNKDNDQANMLKESIFQKKYMKPLFIGIALMFFQQFSGVNGLLTNLSDLFTNAGVNLESGIASSIASSAQIIAVLCGGILMDFFGRKKLWIMSSFGLVIALIIYVIPLKVDTTPVLPIIAIFVFMFAFGIGLGPIPWFIIPEMFPYTVRSTAQSICSAVNWVCAFIVIFIFNWLISLMGQFGTMILFCVICLGSAIFGIFVISEPSKSEAKYDAIA